MIPLRTRDEVRAIDADAVERLGLPSLVLMENAGLGATDVLLDRLGEHARRVVVVAGPGQNGGDGWVVARQLRNRGFDPVGVLVGEERKVKGDARTNLEVLRALDVPVHVLAPDALGSLDELLGGATLIVDALFGTGLDRPVRGGYADVIDRINAQPVPRVSLDLPSGVDADTGQVLGRAVHADVTPTFAAHKRGLHQHPGVDLAGEVVRVSIGIPPAGPAPAALFEPADVGRVVGPRPPDTHKGQAGHVLVVAGSPGRTGAAYMAGYGALRAGAGLATLAARGAARSALDHKVVELMTAELPEEGSQGVDAAVELARGMDAAVVGPGLGLDTDGAHLAVKLSETLPVPAVLDADALTAIADAGPERLRSAAGARVLTPHPGEAARLLGRSTREVQEDRYATAAELASRTGQVAVLKGARSIVALPDGRMHVCRRGSPALAVAGTGDILCGITAARLAVSEPGLAASVAVCLHALSGELASVADRGLFAREVADALGQALSRCRRAVQEGDDPDDIHGA